ncbi:MAG: 50S ribosomal protein L5 [Deltaproteobacteria bacterium]|nr:50S ribosomal protein L5 [Deltaproteobacteria bacterium]
MARMWLEEQYHTTCAPALANEFHYASRMQVPRLTKIVVNTSLKEAAQDARVMDTAAAELAQITGQTPVIRRAKKSIANFKLRAGVPIGCMVTRRRRMMYEFFVRLVNVVLPRVRDFKGVPGKAFDGQGNYTLGLTEQIIFPEINIDKVSRVHGMNITFVTTAKTDREGRRLLELLGMPFRA